jgi:hypothetical protein
MPFEQYNTIILFITYYYNLLFTRFAFITRNRIVIRALHPVTIIFIFNIVLPYSVIFGSVQSIAFATLFLAYCPTPQCQPHSVHKPYGPSFTGFKTALRKIWPSLLPPREVDHNSQTVQSCVSLEKT